MAVVVLTSGAGAPGVTSTCLALAAHWPSPVVLVEADPSGSSAVMAGYLRGSVPGLAGVLEAAVAVRSGSLRQMWSELLIRLPLGAAMLMPALALPAQRRTMAGEWQQLAPAIAELAQAQGMDVLVDAGRLGSTGFAEPLVRLADRVFLATRSTLRSIHATSVWVEEVTAMTMDPSRLQLAVIGPSSPYTSRELSKYLGLGVARELPLDPGGAVVYSDGAPPKRKRSSLDASAQRWAEELHAALVADAIKLAATSTEASLALGANAGAKGVTPERVGV